MCLQNNSFITINNAAHQEALKREIERLRQVYHQQNIKNNASPSPSPKPPCDNDTHIENEHLINV